MTGASMFPSLRACMPFADRSPRFIFVGESSVLGGKSKVRKKDGRSGSFRFGFQACLLSSIRAETILGTTRLGRSCLGLCLSQGSGRHKWRIRSGSTPCRIISLRKPLPAPIRSWVFSASHDRDESGRRTICSLSYRAHPCRSLAGPFSVFEGLMPRQSDFRATHPSSLRLPV
jgi:hypothetical protein